MKKLVYIMYFFLFTTTSFAQSGKMSSNKDIEITSIRVYPNPFSDKTKISFRSATEGNITFIVQDLLGNIVKSENILLVKGNNTIPFYKNKLAVGIYVYTLKSKDKVISKRFVIK